MNKFNNFDFTETSKLFNNILNISSGHSVIAVSRDYKVILWNKASEDMFDFNSNEMLENHFPEAFFDKKSSKLIKKYLNASFSNDELTDLELTAINKTKDPFPVSISVIIGKSGESKLSSNLIIIRDLNKSRLNEAFNITIFEIAKHVNSSKTIELMCNSILDSMCNFLDTKCTFFCFLDHLNYDFKIQYSRGLKSPESHHCKYCSNSRFVEEDKKSCFFSYYNNEITSSKISNHSIRYHIQDKEILSKDYNIMHIPLITDENLIGMLHLVISKSNKQILINHPQILQLISTLISDGIVRRRLVDEIREYADNLEKMVKVRTSQLREKDAQLIQSGKLATLGELATGIAHEINQPLGGISLITQGLQLAKSKGKLTDPLLDEKLKDIVEQIDRIDKIIKHLKTFARQTDNIHTKIDVRSPINDVLKLIGQQLKQKNIELVLLIDDDLPKISAEHNRLEQVLLNLISNAKDALTEMDEIMKEYDIKNSFDENEHFKEIVIKAYQQESEVLLEVKDNGIGIPHNNLDRVFDPFYTTKEVGKGTGLGLSISYGIMKEFGGTITVESQENIGTKFTLKFPL